MRAPGSRLLELTVVHLTFPEIVESTDPSAFEVESRAEGPSGSLPLTDEMLRHWPSVDLFELSQNAGVKWAGTCRGPTTTPP